MGIYVNGIDMPKQDEILQIRIYGDGKVSKVYDIECQQIGTAIQTTQVVPIEDVWRGVQPLKDKILELEEKLYLQKERQGAEWIPVSERLPEDGVAVLITTENEEVYIDQVITDPYKERYFQSNTGYDNFQVIAWMPLPKPYKAESEVEE